MFIEFLFIFAKKCKCLNDQQTGEPWHIHMKLVNVCKECNTESVHGIKKEGTELCMHLISVIFF